MHYDIDYRILTKLDIDHLRFDREGNPVGGYISAATVAGWEFEFYARLDAVLTKRSYDMCSCKVCRGGAGFCRGYTANTQRPKLHTVEWKDKENTVRVGDISSTDGFKAPGDGSTWRVLWIPSGSYEHMNKTGYVPCSSVQDGQFMWWSTEDKVIPVKLTTTVEEVSA